MIDSISISELIKKLEMIKEEHGDIQVLYYGRSPVMVQDEYANIYSVEYYEQRKEEFKNIKSNKFFALV